MSTTYTDIYGIRPHIGYYTDYPEHVIDSNNLWSPRYLGPVDPEVKAMITANPDYLKRFIIRIHDLGQHKDRPHLLYIFDDQPLDLSMLAAWVDLEHTTYFEDQRQYALYRRDREYKIKHIDNNNFESAGGIISRMSAQKTGVIFIDCWPIEFSWQDQDPDFDFYKNMLGVLSRFRVDSFVFHTSFFNLDIISQKFMNYVKFVMSQNSTDSDKWQQIQALIEFSGEQTIDPALRELTQDSRSMLIPNIDGFQRWQQESGINNWIVVGMHWQICTHEKPLGFYNLKKLKQKNPLMQIYSLPQCTARWVVNEPNNQVARLCNQQDYKQDSIDWNFFGGIAQIR